MARPVVLFEGKHLTILSLVKTAPDQSALNRLLHYFSMCHFAVSLHDADADTNLLYSSKKFSEKYIAATRSPLIHSLAIATVLASRSLRVALAAVKDSRLLAITSSRSIAIACSRQLQHPTGSQPLSPLPVHHCLVHHSSLVQFASVSWLTISCRSIACAVPRRKTVHDSLQLACSYLPLPLAAGSSIAVVCS